MLVSGAVLFFAGCATGGGDSLVEPSMFRANEERITASEAADEVVRPQSEHESDSAPELLRNRRSIEGPPAKIPEPRRRGVRTRSRNVDTSEDPSAYLDPEIQSIALESGAEEEQSHRRRFWRRSSDDGGESSDLGQEIPPDRIEELPEKPWEEEQITARRGWRARLFGRGVDTAEDLQEVIPQVATPVTSVAPISARRQESILRPGLPLSITVLVAGRAEVESSGIRISDRGSIVLPLVGSVSVSHLNLEELHDDLTARYSRFFVDPQVIVDFARDGTSDGISPWGYVTVLGRVRNPGRVMIPATRDLTVSGAIQRAGGFDTSARVNAIRVTRRISEDETETRVINLIAVGADGRLEDDVLLIMDDVVFVPEARF